MGLFDSLKNIVENPVESFNRIKTEIVDPAFSTIKNIPGGSLAINYASRYALPYMDGINQVGDVAGRSARVFGLDSVANVIDGATGTANNILEEGANLEDTSELKNITSKLQEGAKLFGEIRDISKQMQGPTQRPAQRAPTSRPGPSMQQSMLNKRRATAPIQNRSYTKKRTMR